jgi:hypothetical protein
VHVLALGTKTSPLPLLRGAHSPSVETQVERLDMHWAGPDRTGPHGSHPLPLSLKFWRALLDVHRISS